MSKADRIPDAWPAQMSDVIAARYCDYSLSQFQAMVRAGLIEAGKRVPGTHLVRWHRTALDRHLVAIHGAAIHGVAIDGIIDSGAAGDAASPGDGKEWLDSLHEGGSSLSQPDHGEGPGVLVLSPERRKRAARRRAG